MTDSSFSDSVAIDTNVFRHLINPQDNIGLHINKLLEHLQHLGVRLILDDKGCIFGEYSRMIVPLISTRDDTGNERQILNYWVHYMPRRIVDIDCQDGLMTSIAKVICEPAERVDRILVYVALRSGRILITNDKRHILSGPDRGRRNQCPRRKILLCKTSRIRSDGAGILSSQEAHGMIDQS